MVVMLLFLCGFQRLGNFLLGASMGLKNVIRYLILLSENVLLSNVILRDEKRLNKIKMCE